MVREPNLNINDLGLIDYNEALQIQLDTLDKVSSGESPDTLIVCSHPHVLTTGRATESGDIERWDGPVYEVQRGGRVTYHGPGQIVVYPVLKLENEKRDLNKYLRALEEAIILTLNDLGIESGRSEKDTGVWVGDKKIASIGIAVKKWTTYHGLALNVMNDFALKGVFKPCGFSQETMVGVDELSNLPVSYEEIKDKLISHLTEILGATSFPL